MMSDALAPAPLGLASGPTLVRKIRRAELANPFSLSVAGSRAPAIHKRSTDHSELASRLPRSGDVWPEADRKLWLQLLEGSFNLIYKGQTGYHQLTQDFRETMTKSYRLLGADGHFYSSTSKGLLGGNNRGKIYGRLDCPSALRAVKRGQTYQQHRVFFADEPTAVAAGFRPCAVCMRDAYKKWRARQ